MQSTTRWCSSEGSMLSCTYDRPSLFRFELLETNYVRFSLGQPSQEVVEPLIDVVNVERWTLTKSPSVSVP